MKVQLGHQIIAEKLPKGLINNIDKIKVIEEKKHYKKYIFEDIVCSILLLLFSIALIYYLLSDKIDIGYIVISILCILLITFTFELILSIPIKIKRWRNYNFERTCYATITNKYTFEERDSDGESIKKYAINFKVKDTSLATNLVVGKKKYQALEIGQEVIVVSFDGYRVQIIQL